MNSCSASGQSSISIRCGRRCGSRSNSRSTSNGKSCFVVVVVVALISVVPAELLSIELPSKSATIPK